jgi:hypothetical protein
MSEKLILALDRGKYKLVVDLLPTPPPAPANTA